MMSSKAMAMMTVDDDDRRWQYSFRGRTRETIYPGDIYIEAEVIGEEYAMDLLFWCENSAKGDKYFDNDFTIECL